MKKIAILDDAEHIVTLLSERLAGHEVHGFTNPEKFIHFVDTNVCDVIITDLRVSRYDAIKNIRKFKNKNIAVKVIVMSAYFNEDNLFALISCHIYEAVKKTHELDYLDTIVNLVEK